MYNKILCFLSKDFSNRDKIEQRTFRMYLFLLFFPLFFVSGLLATSNYIRITIYFTDIDNLDNSISSRAGSHSSINPSSRKRHHNSETLLPPKHQYLFNSKMNQFSESESQKGYNKYNKFPRLELGYGESMSYKNNIFTNSNQNTMYNETNISQISENSYSIVSSADKKVLTPKNIIYLIIFWYSDNYLIKSKCFDSYKKSDLEEKYVELNI
ncbi:hypothetical protein CWI39_0630p0010 [Hamiltosporidium magnivora]|uniref:Uncharacterized protein n=1 Tax=Hamiltosporidium magnivora TaxID=148818 RepID=A0A4Q9LFS6_9MICR|nr:hypothetical protein CWI39_0630p0010 [Hamiltosporidium magnivora]